jgi:hypothetical protein
MYDQPGVRVRDGVEDLQEQVEARGHAQGARFAVVVDVPAFDVLEREVGLPRIRDAGVVQPADVPMLQARENLPLARHPIQQGRALPDADRQLQRHPACDEVVGALGEPHRTHAALCQLPDEPVRPDQATLVDRTRRVVHTLVVQIVETREREPGVRGREQAAQAGLDGGVLRPERVDPAGACLWGQVERGVEELIEGRPVVQAHRGYCSASRRSSFAFSQSRRTVRSVISSVSAISWSVMPQK